MIKRIKYNQKYTIPVESNRKILNYFVKRGSENFELNKKRLQSDLRKEFKSKLGRQDNVFNGEFTHYIWYVEYEGLKFKIFSAKDKGTSYEICNFSHEEIWKADKKLVKKIIGFLDEIDNVINN